MSEAFPDMDGSALAGLRVLDCASIFAGPLIASILGDFGADVIKIEHPTGDALRSVGQKKKSVTVPKNTDAATARSSAVRARPGASDPWSQRPTTQRAKSGSIVKN